MKLIFYVANARLLLTLIFLFFVFILVITPIKKEKVEDSAPYVMQSAVRRGRVNERASPFECASSPDCVHHFLSIGEEESIL